MKQIFTYPDNITSAFIDPDYVGDSNSGFTRRIDDLRAGNYLPWLGLDPVADLGRSTNQLMANISKFNNYYYSTRSGDNISMFDFWNKPLVKANKKLIDAEVVSLGDVDTTAATLTHTTSEFETGMLMEIDFMDGSWATLNGNEYYADVISNTQVKLRVGASDGPYVRFYNLENALVTAGSATSEALFTASAGHDLQNGTHVNVTNLNGSLVDFNNQDYYVTGVSGNDFKLALNSDQTGIIGIAPPSVDNPINNLVLKNNGSVVLNADVSVDQLPASTQISIDNLVQSGYNLNNELATNFSNTYYLAVNGADSYTLCSDLLLANTIDHQSDLTPSDFIQTFNTSIARAGNNYELHIQIQDTNFVTSGVPDKIINMTDTSWDALPVLSTTSYYDLTRDSSNTYKINEYDISNYVMNANTVNYTTTDPRVIIPKIYDSAGAEITTSSFILDTTTISANNTLLDSIFANREFFALSSNNIDNLPPGLKSLARRSATYNNLPVIDVTDITGSGPISQNFDTSGLTNNVIDWADSSNGYPVIRKSDGGQAEAFYNYCKALYDVNPNNILLNPIACQYNHLNIPAETFYLVVVHMDSAAVFCHFYSFADDGTPTWWDKNFNAANDIETYKLMPYDIDTSGGATRTIDQSNNIFSWTNNIYGNPYIIFQGSNVSYWNIKSGMIVDIKFYDNATNTLQETFSNYVLLDSREDGDYRFQLMEIQYGILRDPTQFGPVGLFNDYPTSTYYMELTTNDELAWKRTGLSDPVYQPPADNFAFVEKAISQTTDSGLRSNITEFKYQGHQFDVISEPLVDSTQGDVIQIRTPEDAGQIQLNNLTVATTGNIALATNEPFKYEIDEVNIFIGGNQQFSYKDVNNVTTYAARVDPYGYWGEGDTQRTNYAATGETPAQFTVTVDGAGRLSGIALVEEPDAEGRYADGDQILLPIRYLPNEYVAPVVTPAEEQDNWDTADQWDTDGYDKTKLWPTHIAPTGIKITTAQPSVVNRSQNGTKYVRSLGLVKQQLEVSYPPMSYDDFRQFEATVEAARGQATPFYLQLRDVGVTGNNLLMARKTPSTTNELRINQAVSTGDKTVLLEGFASFESSAIVTGEALVLDAGYANGGVVQVINSTDANVFGEAKIRIPYAARNSLQVGKRIYKDPYQIVVTLGADDLEYTVGTDGYYRMSVMFDLDEWK